MTEETVGAAVDDFIDKYNTGRIDEAANFYAAHAELHYNGTPLMGQESIREAMLRDVDPDHVDQIFTVMRTISLSPSRRNVAYVVERFRTINGSMGVATLEIHLISGELQVVTDTTVDT